MIIKLLSRLCFIVTLLSVLNWNINLLLTVYVHQYMSHFDNLQFINVLLIFISFNCSTLSKFQKHD